MSHPTKRIGYTSYAYRKLLRARQRCRSQRHIFLNKNRHMMRMFRIPSFPAVSRHRMPISLPSTDPNTSTKSRPALYSVREQCLSAAFHRICCKRPKWATINRIRDSPTTVLAPSRAPISSISTPWRPRAASPAHSRHYICRRGAAMPVSLLE